MTRTIVWMLLFVILRIQATGQSEWKLRQDKEGIEIYSRSSEYSEFDEFRAVTQLEQSVHAFAAVLKDVERIPDWMYSVKHAELLERSGDSIQVYYTEAKAPFPLKNRDGVYLNRFRWEGTANTLFVDIEVQQGTLDKKEDLVRIDKGRGLWKAKLLGSGKVEITFRMQVDPGGSIPSWLANMFVVDTPFETLKKLKELIAEEKYARARYDFITDE